MSEPSPTVTALALQDVQNRQSQADPLHCAESSNNNNSNSNERLIAYELLDPSADYAWKWYLATVQGGACASATAFNPLAPHDASFTDTTTASTASATHSGAASPRAIDLAQMRVLQVQQWRSAGSLADTLTAARGCADLGRLETPRESSPTTTAAPSPVAGGRQKSASPRVSVVSTTDSNSAHRKARQGSGSPGRGTGSTPATARSAQRARDANASDGDNDDDFLAQTLNKTHALLREGMHTPRSAEGKALAAVIEAKKLAFDIRAADIKDSMREMRKEQDEAMKAQAEAEMVYKRSQKELRKARKNVEHLDPKHMREVQTYRTPPAVVQWVMKGVMVALGDSARDWKDITSVMRSPAFIPSVVTFEAANLTPAQRKELMHTYVVKPRFSAEEVSKGSEAVGPLYEWIVRELDMGDALERLEVVRTEEEKRRHRVDSIRARIASSADELESMEDELCDLMDALQRCEDEAAKRDEAAADSAADSAMQSPLMAEEEDGSPSLTTLEGGVKVPRHLLRAALRPWHRPASGEIGVARVLRTSLLCDLGPSPPLGATVTLTPEQRSQLEHALANRLLQNASTATSSAMTAMTADTSYTSKVSLLPAPEAAVAAAATAQSPPAAPQETAQKEAEEAALEARVRALLETLEVTEAMTDQANEAHRGRDGHADAAAENAAPFSVTRLTRAVDVAGARVAAMKAQLDSQQAQLTQCEAQQLSTAQGNPLCAPELTTITHCHKVFEGEEWDMVVEDSPEALKAAFTEDVASICRVPNARVSRVSFLVGSLHVDFDVQHATQLTSLQVQDAIDIGEYPSTFGIYSARHARRAEKQKEKETAPSLTLPARHRPLQPQSSLGPESPTWPGGLPPLSDTAISSGVLEHSSSGSRIGSGRGAGPFDSSQTGNFGTCQDNTPRTPQFPAINMSSSQHEVIEEQREQRAFNGMMREAQRLSMILEEKDTLLEASQQQAKLAHERLTQLEVEHARVQDELKQEIVALQERVESLQTLHAMQTQSEGLQANADGIKQRGFASSGQPSSARARALATAAGGDGGDDGRVLGAGTQETALITTHCHKVFEGDEWDMVVEDSPEDLARAIVDDAAAACILPNKCIQHLHTTLGSLHVDFDVQHPADVSPEEVQQRIESATFDSVRSVYAARHERRQSKQAQEEELTALKAAKEAAEAQLHAQQAELKAAKTQEEVQKEATVAELRRQLEAKSKEAEKAQQAETKAAEQADKLQRDLFDKEEELLAMEDELREARHTKDVERDELVRSKQELEEALQQQQETYMAEMNRLREKVAETARAKERALEASRESAKRQRDEVAVAKATAALEEAARAKNWQEHEDALLASDHALCTALEADVATKDAAKQFCEKELAAPAIDAKQQQHDEEEERAAQHAHAARMETLRNGIARLEAAQAAAENAKGGSDASATQTELNKQKTALASELRDVLGEVTRTAKEARAAEAHTQAEWHQHEAAMQRAADHVEQARRARTTLEDEMKSATTQDDAARLAALQTQRQAQEERIVELQALSTARNREVGETMQSLVKAQAQRAQRAEAAVRDVEMAFGIVPSSPTNEDENTPSAGAVRARGGVQMSPRAALLSDIYATAAAGAGARREVVLRNACFAGMLIVGLASLEYKKYGV